MLKGLGDGDHVWTGLKGPLTFHGVKLAYRRLFDRAGIQGPKKGAHTLRHTFATMWLRYGGGLRQLQTIMGHKHIETTMIYVHWPATTFSWSTPDIRRCGRWGW